MMKKLVISAVCLFFLTGCIGTGGYDRYLDAKRYQMNMERKPLIELALDKDGKLESLAMYERAPHINIEQEKDHAMWRVAGGLVKMVGVVGSIMATGDAISDIVTAGSGDTTINSNNDQRANEGTMMQSSEFQLDQEVIDTNNIDFSEGAEVDSNGNGILGS